jgi:hypothetical protein
MIDIRKRGTGLSFILLPLLFVFGCDSHPNLQKGRLSTVCF